MRLQQAVMMRPAEGSCPTADQGQDGDAGAAHLEDGADDLGDRELAGIRLLEPDAAGIEQQQHGAGAAPPGAVARGPQQTNEFRAVDLAERTSQEAALLRGDEDLLAVEAARVGVEYGEDVKGTREPGLGW
jgi:hypothetical protein